MTTLRDNELLVTVSRLRPDGQVTHTRVLIDPADAPVAAQLEAVGGAIKAGLRDLSQNPGTGRETQL